MREQLRWLLPDDVQAVRFVPIEGVVLTDAEIDHSLGVVLLRESRHLPLYVTAAVRSILDRDSRLLPVTQAFSEVPVTELPLERDVALRHRDGTGGLVIRAFEVPADPPRFASKEETGHTVGLMVQETATGKCLAFVPGCAALDSSLAARLATADALLFDGTFWSDDELIAGGIGTRTARQLDHLPIGGPGGSLEQLAALPCRHRVYTHINNTNPVLLEQSAERAAVTRAGVVVGFDGLRLNL